MTKDRDEVLHETWPHKTVAGADLYGKLYTAMAARHMVGRTDEVHMTDKIAKRMYEIGKEHMGEKLPVPLEVFSMMFYFDDPEIFEMFQPMNPYRDDVSILGVKATFVNEQIKIESDDLNDVAVCLEFFETHGDTGGMEEIATMQILLFKEGPAVLPLLIEEDALCITDYETIEMVSIWLGYVWQGIQYSMLHKPEITRVTHHRVPKEERDEALKQSDNRNRKRVVKVQRVITIIDDGESEITITRGGHSITLPVWSVSGHWRTYKSGKKVWINSYLKGKERDSNTEFCHKEYRFVEEDE